MVFTVLGAVAELERNLIVERVRAGLRHAVSKGKRLGRPKKYVDAAQIASLRASGHSWRTISRKMGVSVGTVYAAVQERQQAAPASSLADSSSDRRVAAYGASDAKHVTCWARFR